jgi:ribosomal protein L37E
LPLPELIGCPHCGKSLHVRPKSCPGCGYAIRAYRVRVTIGDRANVVERVVAIKPEDLPKFRAAYDVVEEIPPDDEGEA